MNLRQTLTANHEKRRSLIRNQPPAAITIRANAAVGDGIVRGGRRHWPSGVWRDHRRKTEDLSILFSVS